MRFVVGTPEEHLLFINNNDNNHNDGDNNDDSVVAMCSTPIRRGSSWLIATVTSRMRFLVFSCEGRGEKLWSRRVVGQLPVAAGAVTEGRHRGQQQHQLRRNSFARSSNPDLNQQQYQTSLHLLDQQQEKDEKELIRIVESPLSIHFHSRGQRIAIATSVKRILILEIDAEMGNDTTPLTHKLTSSLDDASQQLFGNPNVATPNNTISNPLPNMQNRWCVANESFVPQGLIQNVDTSCGGNVFTVCSSSGHIFVISWLNGSVLHELNFFDSSVIRRKYLNGVTFSTRLRLGAVSFLDGSVCVTSPSLLSSSKAENAHEDDETGGATVPLDVFNPELVLKIVGSCENAVTPASLNSNNNTSQNTSPTAIGRRSSTIPTTTLISQQQTDSSSIIKFLTFNTKYKILAFSGSRLSTLTFSDVSSVADNPSDFVNIGEKQPKPDQEQQREEPVVKSLPLFHRLSQTIRNTLFDISPLIASGKVNNNNFSNSKMNPTFRQIGLGELRSLSWSPDEDVISLSFSHAGICLFDISGVLLFHSWKHHHNNYSTHQQLRGIFASSASPSSENPFVSVGVLSALWMGPKRILALSRSGVSVTKLELATAVCEATSAETERDGSALLLGTEELWHYCPPKLLNDQLTVMIGNNNKNASSQQQQYSTTNSPVTSWDRIRVPQNQYLARNYPLRFASASPDGSKIIVSGRRGFAVWDKNICKWKTFVLDGDLTATTLLASSSSNTAASSNAEAREANSPSDISNATRFQIEQSFSVVSTPVWLGNEVVVVPCELVNPSAKETCRFGTDVAGNGALLMFSLHALSDFAVLNAPKNQEELLNSAKTSSKKLASFVTKFQQQGLLDLIPLGGGGIRPYLVSSSYRGSNTTSPQHFSSSYIISLLDSHGNLKFFEAGVYLVSPQSHQRPILSSLENSYVDVRVKQISHGLYSSSGNLTGIPFVTPDQAVSVITRASEAHQRFVEAEETKRKNTEERNPVQDFGKMKQKAYAAAVAHQIKRLQTRDGFFISQPTDVKQIFCFSSWLGDSAAASSTGDRNNNNNNKNRSSSFFLVILLFSGQLLLLDVGSKSQNVGGIFSSITDPGILFGEILSDSSTFVSRMWPAFVSSSPQNQHQQHGFFFNEAPKPLEVLVTFGSDGLSGTTFINNNTSFMSQLLATASGTFQSAAPTLFSLFKYKTDVSPFDNESIPIAIAGSMPLWVSPKIDAATSFSHSAIASQFLPCFDVSNPQPTIVLHLTTLLPLVAGSFDTALMKSSSASSANNQDQQYEQIQADVLELMRSISAQLKRQRALVESFDCVLYQILHASLNELLFGSHHSAAPNGGNSVASASASSTSSAGGIDRRQILSKVVTFLKTECSSQDFFDICVLTLRKTDEARCTPLFDVLGPPNELFDHCVANNHLLCALHLLRVIQMFSSQQKQQQQKMLTVSKTNKKDPLLHCYESAKKLFGLVLRQYDQSVSIDLLRYLVLIQSELDFFAQQQKQGQQQNGSNSGGNSSFLTLRTDFGNEQSKKDLVVQEEDSSKLLVVVPGKQQQQTAAAAAANKNKPTAPPSQPSSFFSSVTSTLFSVVTLGLYSLGNSTDEVTNNSAVVVPNTSQKTAVESPTTRQVVESKSIPSHNNQQQQQQQEQKQSTQQQKLHLQRQQDPIALLDASPAEILNANEDLMNEVLSVAESHLLGIDADFSASAFLQIIALFDGFGLDPNIFFNKIQDQQNILPLDCILASLISAFDLQDAEHVVYEGRNRQSQKRLNFDDPVQIVDAIKNNNFNNIITPTQVALLSKTSLFFSEILLRLKRIFSHQAVQNKSTYFARWLLILELILLNEEGMKTCVGLLDSTSKDELINLLKEEYCEGYSKVLEILCL